MKSPSKNKKCSRFICKNYNYEDRLHGDIFENIENNNLKTVHINCLN